MGAGSIPAHGQEEVPPIRIDTKITLSQSGQLYIEKEPPAIEKVASRHEDVKPVVKATPKAKPKPVAKAPVATPKTAPVPAQDGKPRKVRRSNIQCAMYVQGFYPGVHTGDGFARTYPINSQVPKIGGVVVTRESSRGHVAIITGIEDGYLVLEEANYITGWITDSRKLAITSPLIKGYYVR